MRHYVLDGHNILHRGALVKQSIKARIDLAMNALILRCQRIVTGKQSTCSVFFDGAPPGNVDKNIKNVHVAFSYDRSADSLIKSLIERSKNPRNLIVVSDDAEIQRFARAYSCTIQSVSVFLSGTFRSEDREMNEKTIPDNISIEEWLRLFNE
jgi:predicted RNA-binding protein with PIN domain